MSSCSLQAARPGVFQLSDFVQELRGERQLVLLTCLRISGLLVVNLGLGCHDEFSKLSSLPHVVHKLLMYYVTLPESEVPLLASLWINAVFFDSAFYLGQLVLECPSQRVDLV